MAGPLVTRQEYYVIGGHEIGRVMSEYRAPANHLVECIISDAQPQRLRYPQQFSIQNL